MALTVTAEPGNLPPRQRIDITGLAGATVTVTRTNDDGSVYVIRSANPATMTSGAWTGYDYESPFNQGGTYLATSDTGTTFSRTASPLRNAGVTQAWLIHPGVPSLSVPLDGPTLGDETADLQQGVHVVLGRPDPVIIGDGVRHLPTLQLTIKAHSTAADAAIRALLADGSVLLLQYVFDFTTLSDYYWVSVGQTTRGRVTDNYAEPYYLWTLPLTVTSSPPGLLQSQFTFADVLADWSSFAQLTAHYATFHDLLIDNRT